MGRSCAAIVDDQVVQEQAPVDRLVFQQTVLLVVGSNAGELIGKAPCGIFLQPCVQLIGCSLPILAKKIGFDPAVMASPLITTLVDALSLLVYCAVATAVLGL